MWWYGQRNKLATNSSTTFLSPLQHVPWCEMSCQELLISSLLSGIELCITISEVWPARRVFPWLSCTSEQAACFNSDVKTVTILGNPAALLKSLTKSCNFKHEKYSKMLFLQLVPHSPPTHICLTEANHEGHFLPDVQSFFPQEEYNFKILNCKLFQFFRIAAVCLYHVNSLNIILLFLKGPLAHVHADNYVSYIYTSTFNICYGYW